MGTRVWGLVALLIISYCCACSEDRFRPEELGFEPPEAMPIPLDINGHTFELTDSNSILTHASLLEDPTGSLTYEQVIARTDFGSTQPYLEPLSTKSVYWLHFSLESLDTIHRSLLLYIGHEQQAEIYGPNQRYRIGTMVPAREERGAIRPGLYLREAGFSGQLLLKLAPQRTTDWYIRINRVINNPLPLELKLIHPTFWETRLQAGLRHFGQGVFQGMIWALILYHLMLFWMIRDSTYLYYCVYMICISALTSGDFGYWQGYLFANQPYLGWCLFLTLQYFTGIMTFVFMQRFVELERLLPHWDRRVTIFIQANLGLLLLFAVGYFLTQDYRVIQVAKVLIVPFAVMGLLFCYLLIRSGDTVALYFAVAGGILSIAIAISAGIEASSEGGRFAETSYLRYGIIQVTAVLHLLTFSIGMGYRRREKDRERQRVLELDQLKTRLYTNITHEFRTPLTVILGMNEGIRGHDRARNLIRRNGYHLLRLINQLLDLSKLESGQLTVRSVLADVIPFLQYLTESFASLASDKEVQLTFYPEVEQLEMDYDPAKLQHIVYNLLSNAIKYTDAGGKVILHVQKISRKKEDWLQLKFKDTGRGIAADQQEQVFDRFYQVDNSQTRSGEGTGIGLALTKELIELLNGRIELQSELGKGSEFTVFLPITQRAVPSSESLEILPIEWSTAAQTTAQALPAEDSDTPVLLIVEDNTDVVTYIESLLASNYQMVRAADGEAGWERALELIPDIIISDIMMPKLDGYALCARLKTDERTNHIPVILLTAKAAADDKVAGLQRGADAFLSKPFHPEELQVRLEQLIRQRRLLQKRYANGFVAAERSEKALTPEEQFIDRLRAAVQAELSDSEFGVPQLAQSVSMSQMQVYRKLKAITNQTPSQFIRSIRLEAGRALLGTPDLTIAEIAYDVGFSDPNYFSRTFQQQFGASPSDYRSKVLG